VAYVSTFFVFDQTGAIPAVGCEISFAEAARARLRALTNAPFSCDNMR